jgi:hypothetical protein
LPREEEKQRDVSRSTESISGGLNATGGFVAGGLQLD